MKATCVDFTRCAQRHLGPAAAVLGVLVALSAGRGFANEAAPEGRLDFEAAKLPTANLEVDLSEETFASLFGISDAAIAGVAETFFKAADKAVDGEGGSDKQLTAGQIEAVRKIVELGGKFVREVRVRAYENCPDEVEDVGTLLKPLDGQLKAGKWETVVRMRSDDDMVRVAVLQKDGDIRGIYVAATDGDGIAVVNVVCDISPDKVKPLTAAVAKIGMTANIQPVIRWTISRTGDSPESCVEGAPCKAAGQAAAVAAPAKQSGTLKK